MTSRRRRAHVSLWCFKVLSTDLHLNFMEFRRYKHIQLVMKLTLIWLVCFHGASLVRTRVDYLWTHKNLFRSYQAVFFCCEIKYLLLVVSTHGNVQMHHLDKKRENVVLNGCRNVNKIARLNLCRVFKVARFYGFLKSFFFLGSKIYLNPWTCHEVSK